MTGGAGWVGTSGWWSDDNPDQRQNTHRECSRCSKIKDQTEFEHTKSTWMSMGPGF